MIRGRALHFVFKVADRKATTNFYREILGMKVLRHEEFSEGCDAACNGKYANRWSKTMVGYGSEDTHFVMELTYNYPVDNYERGNDFIGITIKSRETLERARVKKWPIKQVNGVNVVEAPGGYEFFILDEPQPTDKDPVQKVSLASSNLKQSIAYWNGLLGLKMYHQANNKSALFGFADSEAKLEMIDIGTAVDHAKAYGRIAFSCPYDQQPTISEKMENAKQTIITPLISLDTPGKATVRVIILGDPDQHEICFVNDEGYKELSAFDPEGEILLDRYIKLDPRQ